MSQEKAIALVEMLRCPLCGGQLREHTEDVPGGRVPAGHGCQSCDVAWMVDEIEIETWQAPNVRRRSLHPSRDLTPAEQQTLKDRETE